jgi:hypothetical protein
LALSSRAVPAQVQLAVLCAWTDGELLKLLRL